MNEIVAIASFVGLAALVLFAARLGETFLFVLSVTFIFLSNITVQMPVRVFGAEISWAIIIYSLVYFITDLLCEYHGRAAGYRLAATNLAVQVILWAYVWASLQVSPVEAGLAAYETASKLFATTAQITFAAIIASLGPFLDIFIFSSLPRASPATQPGLRPGTAKAARKRSSPQATFRQGNTNKSEVGRVRAAPNGQRRRSGAIPQQQAMGARRSQQTEYVRRPDRKHDHLLLTCVPWHRCFHQDPRLDHCIGKCGEGRDRGGRYSVVGNGRKRPSPTS